MSSSPDHPAFRVPRADGAPRDVRVVFGPDGYAATREALCAMPFDFAAWRDRRVLIKPNAGRCVGPNLGINTSPDVVAGVVDFLLEAGVRNLMVGDSPILGVTAMQTLEESGIAAVVRERDVALVDLDARKPQVVEIPNPKVVRSLKVCRDALEAEILVSVPVMKTHMHTQVSLGLKNMKGCLYKREKVRLHQLPALKGARAARGRPLDMAIADLSKVLLPDLTVIDGTIGQEGLGPSAGEPKPLGAIVASFNCLAADTVAVRLMGQLFDVARVRVIRLVAMHVHHQAALGGDLAQLGDRAAAIGHGAFEMRNAAHDINTKVQRA